MNARRFAAACLAANLALSLAACGEKCDPAADLPYCDGAAVVSCPEPGVDQLVGTDRWKRHDCLSSQVCVEPEAGIALCVAEAEPSPLCAGEPSSACESSTSLVYCSRGYVTGRAECLACVAATGYADCQGGFGAPCASAADCVAGRECNDQGHCV